MNTLLDILLVWPLVSLAVALLAGLFIEAGKGERQP